MTTINPIVNSVDAKVLKHFKKIVKSLKSTDRKLLHLVQECSCKGYKKNFTITFDSQDLYEGGYTKCPYCKKPFAKRGKMKGDK